jgi:hypothetical protein
MSDVLGFINQRMHPGATCPTQCPKALGECPIISKDGKWQGQQRYQAILLLWPGSEHLTTAEVIGWFTEAGCQVLRITQTMFEQGLNIDITDGTDHAEGSVGCREWEVHFVRAVPA